ncbi:Cell envelope-associated transcriptional attenuator LytR-CpsA-Psr, subfamily A1 (as in PMID19099556) [hydrothermal vent metagenome]|uniref:Cell envelope-associated transcriptional attenuator LytR-CpsA-Psr, subfamily A1 (As in PMID19099556) n=1 Tax=hydrothermal vent metagenome TaxID=652676 RepID=A0A3B0SM11_9ZZZZ
MPSTTETFPEIPREQPDPRAPKKRWSLAQKFVVSLLALLALGVFAGYGFIRYTEGKIDRIDPSELVSLDAPATAVAAGEPINFLIVGVDDRSDLPDDWEDNFGEFAGRRTDVIMVAHMVPGERIQMLSIPRDLKSDIPGGGINRINASYVLGGPDLLVQTVQAETGIPIHHYIEIDFAGVGAVVDSLGGVTLDFTYPGRDRKSGFSIDAGRHTLDGEQAVAYARSRKYEILKNGKWQSTGGGDIARTGRQQQVLIALFSQVKSPSSAFNLPVFLPTFADQITADEGLTIGLMADLGRSALTLGIANIDNTTLPVKNYKGSDGRAYVVPIDSTQAVIDAFIAGEPFPTE